MPSKIEFVHNMKILMITDTLAKGGKERRLVELLKELSKYDRITLALVVLSEEVFFEEVYALDVNVHLLKRKTRKDVTIFNRLYNICHSFRPTIIQSWEMMASIYAIPVAKLIGAKFIDASIAQAPNKVKSVSRTGLRYRLSYPFTDAIVGNSFAGIKAFKTPINRSYCIHNGFDFTRVQNLQDPKLVREQFGIKTDLVVGMVAAFHPRKDFETYLETAQRLLLHRKDVTFLAVGDGPFLEAMKGTIREDNRSNIIFTGSQDNIESIINIFTVAVLTTYTEGISNSILEYMALGKPVIATSGGGTSEIVEDGVTGFLIPPSDCNSLLEKLEILLDDPYAVEQMGKSGKKVVQDKFNINRMTTDFIRLYHKLIEE